MTETLSLNKRRISHTSRDRTEAVVEKLLKEKEPFINKGSVDVLAKYTIDTLQAYGIKINLWESLATSGKISDAITNNSGVTSVFAHSLITTNAESVEIAMPGVFVGTFTAFGSNSIEAAKISAAKNNNSRSEDITLVTTGNILKRGDDVHVAIMTKKRLRQDSSPMPAVLTIHIEDFEKEIKIHPEYLMGATLNSLKKQYVAHQSLLFLLKDLGASIKPGDLLFQPRQTNEAFLKYRTNLMKNIVRKLKDKKYKLGIAESATGGRLVDALTDVENGNEVLGKCAVFYNEKEKFDAGVPEDALSQAAVYSEITAYHLARTAKPYTQVQIGLTALLDQKDHRNVHTKRHKRGSLFYAILEKDKRAHTKFIEIGLRNRLEMKEMAMIIVYRHLLQIMTEKSPPEQTFE